MGLFTLLVAIPGEIKGCCDTAVAVDRIVRPHMGNLDEGNRLDYYYIDPEGSPDSPFSAYIDLGGCWREDTIFDPEEDDWIPDDDWEEDMKDWKEYMKDPRVHYRFVVCNCHF